MKEINLEEIFKIGALNIRSRIEKTASYSIKEVPYEGTSVNTNELISSIHQLMEDIFKEKCKEFAKELLTLASEEVQLTEFASEFLQEGANEAINKESITNLINRIK